MKRDENERKRKMYRSERRKGRNSLDPLITANVYILYRKCVLGNTSYYRVLSLVARLK